jgi:hypothetical protein
MSDSPVRKAQYTVTRPTSVVVMTLLFEGIQLLFPNALSTNTTMGIYKVLLALGTTGIIDKTIRERKEIWAWIKMIFHRKKDKKEVRYEKQNE